MKKLTTLTLIAAASALALSATAASAQPYAGRHVDRNPVVSVNQRLATIDRRVDRGLRQGDLTRREAQVAQLEMRRIEHRQQQYRPNGYTRWELADLDNRLDRLEAQVRFDRHDKQYGYGYGYDNRR